MATQRRWPLDLSAIAVPSPEVLVQELDGEAVLLNLESERYFGLDDVGTRVWRHLLEHRRLERVCEEMQKEYDVDESTLRADVLQLVEELIDAGIVTVEHVVTNVSADS
jgi:predicted DNA-binding transcriptional regulator